MVPDSWSDGKLYVFSVKSHQPFKKEYIRCDIKCFKMWTEIRKNLFEFLLKIVNSKFNIWTDSSKNRKKMMGVNKVREAFKCFKFIHIDKKHSSYVAHVFHVRHIWFQCAKCCQNISQGYFIQALKLNTLRSEFFKCLRNVIIHSWTNRRSTSF